VSEPNFEIVGGFRAERFVMRASVEAETSTDQTELTREERREGLPPTIEPGRFYRDVVVENRLAGTLADGEQECQ
jgi:hypothetical protein